MATILDGKKVAGKLAEKVKEKVKFLNEQKIFPTLCVIEVGNDPASKIYLRVKRNLAKQVEINEKTINFDDDVKQDKLIDTIKELNNDPTISAIMVQLPLPAHLDQSKIIEAIDPAKDADGFHPYNQGKLWQGNSQVIPATVRSIMSLLNEYDIQLEGKNALIIGRSIIVGKPLASQLLNKNATVTIAHSKTQNLSTLTKKADIIISDVGQAHLIKEDMIKNDVVLIDVGMNRENGKLLGDINFQTCLPKASAITPVPGGVGPLTVASLMYQVVLLTENQNNG
ncbi:bifunctional 5,10-methylenetetrahydrofolate dehydrogenase/5,10-methenyltetrahydrofolate cyclohydrolase [uncultured Lactobacillus sp.]|uniref:bifunctional 5,10-methylenetetrahydrofolate dehydrogenase/5,10-methenyltetrahydrofolate cyclohydrolase n=1 Tax=uncultured Lactobacillus sp. TaxID=153152 RepID=UPI00260CBB4B|nr:tetrahydrofolate dehydrogenase/cyclohydrolase catalytic domain-containing protein [uncultured Lactobacillus sp.]